MHGMLKYEMEMIDVKAMQRIVDYFWLDIDVNELNWYDYVKMFGIPVGATLWTIFLLFNTTWY